MYYRKREEKRRLKNLSENSNPGYPQPCYYDEKKHRIIRLWKSDGRKSAWKWHKKQYHKKYRRLSKNADYKVSKNVYDLWWNMW